MDAQIERIIKRQAQFTAKSLGLGMLLTRMTGKYKDNPAPETLRGCIAEVNAFIAKYKDVLGEDLACLTKI